MANVVVPPLGESVVEARVSRWLKKEGDRVAVGDALVALETEKVDIEVPADAAGVLTRITRKEGEDVRIGETLGELDTVAAPAGTPAAPDQAVTPGVGSSVAPAAAIAPTREAAIAPIREVDTAPASEAAVAPTSEAKIAPTREAAIAPASAAPIAPRSETRQRMSKRRATIARRLVEAQRTAAMLTTFNEVDMSRVMGVRERHKEAFSKRYGVGLGISSFFVKAAVAALRAFPPLNAEIQGDEIVLKHYYDIGIAVGAEGGLVVPVIRDAGTKSFAELETAMRDFAQRAKDGALTLEDLSGGTFTITNGGVFGSLMSTPILNPPQVGILGLHKIQDRAVPVDGQVAIRPMMYVALSYDHRIVDGREAVQFLVRVKAFVEDPSLLLMEG